jgi:hypothetical protein
MRTWQSLPELQQFSNCGECDGLFDYVNAFFSRGGLGFGTIREEMEGLRYHLQPVLRSEYFTDEVISINLGVPRSTARRFLRHNRYPSYETFLRIMHSLAAQFDVKDKRSRQPLKSAHDIEVEFEGALKTTRREAHDALDELVEALDGLIPMSQHSSDSNRKPVELTVEQYTLLVATVRSAQEFSEVETWDQRTIRVIRALNDILVELDRLLDTATSIFGKQLRAAIRLVTKPLRTALDALDGDRTRQ